MTHPIWSQLWQSTTVNQCCLRSWWRSQWESPIQIAPTHELCKDVHRHHRESQSGWPWSWYACRKHQRPRYQVQCWLPSQSSERDSPVKRALQMNSSDAQHVRMKVDLHWRPGGYVRVPWANNWARSKKVTSAKGIWIWGPYVPCGRGFSSLRSKIS